MLNNNTYKGLMRMQNLFAESVGRIYQAIYLTIFISLSFVGSAYAVGNSGYLNNRIEGIDFAMQSGGRVSVHLKLKNPINQTPASFALNNPPRIALDILNSSNGLGKTNVPANIGGLKSVTLAEAKDRTRLVLNLAKNSSYTTTVNGRDVLILLQSDNATTSSSQPSEFAQARPNDGAHSITKIDFARGKDGAGRVIVDLSDAAAGIDIKQKGKVIEIDFKNTALPANLQRRLNVTSFNTPVLFVDAMKQGNNSHMVIEPKGNWEQSAYQADNKFIVDVRQVIDDPNKLVKGNKSGYSGEKLSLNFQDIDVRSVLQVIADFTGLNIVATDSVTGNITLRLKDVPWDQALDIITQNKNLKIKKNGNVITVAPAEEVAAKEKLQLESNQQIEDLEPMRTEVYRLNYMKAESLKNILTNDKQRILSKRGSAVIDPRTNTVFVQDSSKYLDFVQSVINRTDIPIRQVMIESRLVIADDNFSKALGARFGVSQVGNSASAGTRAVFGGQLNSTGGYYPQGSPNVGTAGTVALAQAGTSLQGTSSESVNIGGSASGTDLMSNLPIANAFGNFAFSLFKLPAGLLLNLELSALESDHRGKVVSSPRVTTADQQKAIITQGTRIPYQQATSSGATSTQFVDATLSLEVTPQITPDDKIIMDLEVKKDRVGSMFNGVPSIDTQRVTTQMLVSNGETAVLGGIYQQEDHNDVDKVPLFGDIPIVGNLFKRRTKASSKTELLIFITPKLMDDSLNLR